MPLKRVPFILIALAVAIIGYGTYQRWLYPPTVLSTGIFKLVDKSGTELIFPKRVVAVAGFETTQVQLPGGTWIDCRGDCAATLKSEHTEFWDHQLLRNR
jgi:hypothetical protein